MKVVHIITGLNDGGAEGALFRLVTNNKTDIDNVVVSLMDEGKYGPILKDLDIKVITLNMKRGRTSLNCLFRLYSIIRKEKPDVVQTWMYHADLLGGIISYICGCRNIVWGIRHSNLSPSVNSRSTIIIAKACAFLSSWIPKKIICCAEESVPVHKAIGYKGDFVVIPNGYDTQTFRKDEALRKDFREELNLGNEIPVVGFVARWDPLKDHKNLILAIDKLRNKTPNICCVLVGTGCDNSNIELISLLNEYNLLDNFILLGRRSDIPRVMNMIDIHVLSSCGEAFPNVVAEAMASGTPCVVTDVGDASSIVGDTGWVVPPKNPEKLSLALSLAIKEMQNSPSAWLERSMNCSNRVNTYYSLSRMIDSYKKSWL